MSMILTFIHVHMMGLQDVHRPAPFTTKADRTGLNGLCAVLPWHKMALRLLYYIPIPGGPKKRYPGFNFAITSVDVHRF